MRKPVVKFFFLLCNVNTESPDHGALESGFLAILTSTVSYNVIDLHLKSHLRILT